MEYNSVFGNKGAISVPYKDDFFVTDAHYSNLFFGASLKAMDYLANKQVDALFIPHVVGMIKRDKLRYTKFSEDACKRIMDKSLEYLRAHPEFYKKLSMDGINTLLTLYPGKKIKQELVVGLHSSKFVKLQEELAEMVEYWESQKNSPAWATMSEIMKKRSHAMVVSAFIMKRFENIYKELKQFPGDPRANDIVKYLEEVWKRLDYTPVAV
jgi:hypothetical protein